MRRILLRRIEHRDLVGLRIHLIWFVLMDYRFGTLKRSSLTFRRLCEWVEWKERILRGNWKLCLQGNNRLPITLSGGGRCGYRSRRRRGCWMENSRYHRELWEKRKWILWRLRHLR